MARWEKEKVEASRDTDICCYCGFEGIICEDLVALGKAKGEKQRWIHINHVSDCHNKLIERDKHENSGP